MPHESLGDFLALLEDAGELVRIAAPVDSALEIAEITRRVGREANGGPALFFESVRGSSLPVVTNLLGNRARLCRALGVNSGDELVDRMSPPAKADGRWAGLWGLAGSPPAGFAPRVLKQAYCQQIVRLGRDVDLWQLPVLRSWAEETHPAITLGQVITRHPTTGARSLECVPIHVLDQQRLAPGWHRHHRGYQHWLAAKAMSQQLPIAIALGGHAAATIAAAATLPDDADPYDFAGALLHSPLEIVKCRTSDLEVPAQAEIVIEGMLDSAADNNPEIQVTALTHRANPIYPAQIGGASSGEEASIRWALERLCLPWVRATAPEIVDLHSPAAGGGRGWLFAGIRKRYPQQAHKVLHALWSHPQTMFAKGIVVVDESVNVQSSEEVWTAFAANVDPATDVVLASGVADIEDPALGTLHPGRKLGIDATAKLPEERPLRSGPAALSVPDDVRRQVQERWLEYGFPTGEERRT